jgi:hypothetical protein
MNDRSMWKMTERDIARAQDLRRSSASGKHRNKSKYTRKAKHKAKRYM